MDEDIRMERNNFVNHYMGEIDRLVKSDMYLIITFNNMPDDPEMIISSPHFKTREEMYMALLAAVSSVSGEKQ